MEINTETDLVNYLKNNWGKCMPGRFVLLGFSYPIYGCVSSEKIGMADIAFKIENNRLSRINFLVEIKFTSCKAESFWESLKVIGYAQSMNLWKQSNQYVPIIMIPKAHLSYDFLPILYNLKCGYISFEIKSNDSVEFEINVNYDSEKFLK